MLGVVMLFLSALGAPGADAAPERGFIERAYRDAAGQESKYSLFVPHGHEPAKPLPVILFLHGSGEIGTDGVAPTRVGIGPAIRKREGDFPFLVVFPQARRQFLWLPGTDDARRAMAILAQVQKDYATDPKRVYLTGISMGGFGTWSLAARYPDRWAAIVPVCGGGDPATAEAIKQIPCWCFHGAADPVVPPDTSRAIIAALKQAGGSPRYDEFPGVGHDSWDKAYATPGLFDWLLQQRLK
jgi:predicted peptidase